MISCQTDGVQVDSYSVDNKVEDDHRKKETVVHVLKTIDLYTVNYQLFLLASIGVFLFAVLIEEDYPRQ